MNRQGGPEEKEAPKEGRRKWVRKEEVPEGVVEERRTAALQELARPIVRRRWAPLSGHPTLSAHYLRSN